MKVKRKLNVMDAVLVSKICSKCSFTAMDLIKILSVGADKPKESTAMFMGAILGEKIIKEMHLFHEELFELISRITGEDLETVENSDLDILIDVFNQIKEKNDLESFFSNATVFTIKK